MSDATPFTITELTGRQRSVVLIDRALPYPPFSLVSSQRTEITWYAGNPEATAQVFGGQLEPTTVNGQWKDKFIGVGGAAAAARVNGVPVTTVSDLCDVIDSIRAEGQLVQVTWDNKARSGIVSKFEQEWHNRHDVEYKITFEWVSVGTPLGPAVLDATTSATTTATRVRGAAARVREEAEPPFAAVEQFGAEVSAALNTIESATRDVDGVLNNLATNVMVPFDAVKRVMSVCSNSIAAAGKLVDIIDGLPARTTAFAADLGKMPLGAILQCEAYTRRLKRNARDLRNLSAEQRAVLLRSVDGELLATHTAVADEDLRDVARAYYGDAAQWRKLALFNQLPGSALRAGQLVLIPRM